MRFIGLVLLIVSFSAHAGWLSANEITIMTGHARTNLGREVRQPVFVTDEGKQIEVEFETQKPAQTWKTLTESGRAHVMVIGAMNGQVLKIFAVETESTTGILRYQAAKAWVNLRSEIAKNHVWMGTFRRSDGNGSGSSNSIIFILTGNFIEYLITTTKDREFLSSIVSINKLAARGIQEPHIKPYLNAFRDLLKLAGAKSARDLQERLMGGEECAELVAQADYRSVVTNLERTISE